MSRVLSPWLLPEEGGPKHSSCLFAWNSELCSGQDNAARRGRVTGRATRDPVRGGRRCVAPARRGTLSSCQNFGGGSGGLIWNTRARRFGLTVTVVVTGLLDKRINRLQEAKILCSGVICIIIHTHCYHCQCNCYSLGLGQFSTILNHCCSSSRWLTACGTHESIGLVKTLLQAFTPIQVQGFQ